MYCDQVGLQTLLEDGQVFACHRNIADAVYHAELGASLAIFKAGYTIDSLMLRYQGVDWTNQSNWNCNAKCAKCLHCQCMIVCDSLPPSCNLNLRISKNVAPIVSWRRNQLTITNWHVVHNTMPENNILKSSLGNEWPSNTTELVVAFAIQNVNLL